jgi:exosortase E/protease (VPEID-CTERM system)
MASAVVAEQSEIRAPRVNPFAYSVLRWGLLSAMLVVEVLWLEMRFDTRLLECEYEWWSVLIGHAPQLLQVAISSAAALCLLGGSQIRTRFLNHRSAIERHSSWQLWLSIHFVCYALFVSTSFIVLGRLSTAEATRNACAGLWLLSGLGMATCWGLAVIPPKIAWEIGWCSRWAVVAAAVVGAVAWFAGDVATYAWPPLSAATFAVVTAILRLVYGDVVVRPELFEINSGDFSVCVGPACSGYEGLGLIAVFISAYLWAFRRQLRFPVAFSILPLGLAAIWLLNSVRIAALFVIGASWSPEIAAGGFHSQAGWLAFNVVALGLVATTVRIPAFSVASAAPAKTEKRLPNYTAAYLGPFLAAVAAGMITGALTGGFDWLYPLRAAASAAVLWAFRGAYLKWQWSLSWQPIGIGAGVALLWIALLPTASASGGFPAELQRLPALASAGWLACHFFGYAVMTPIVEE